VEQEQRQILQEVQQLTLVEEAEQHPQHHLLQDRLAEQVEQVSQEHNQHQELNVV
jgi:hypothetical protein